MDIRIQFEQETNGYCFWDVRNQIDFFIISSNLVIFTIVLLIQRIRKRKQFQQINTNQVGGIKNIEYFLIAWYITYMVQWIYGLAVNALHSFQGIATASQNRRSIYSAFYQLLNLIPSFILLACLFYISHLILSKFISGASTYGENVTLSKCQKLYEKFLKIYQYLRVILVIPALLIPILMIFDSQKYDRLTSLSRLEVSLFLVDIILCNVSLYISMRTLRRSHSKVDNLRHALKKKVWRQTILLQLAGITRFIMGIVFALIQSLFNNISPACPNTNLLRSILYLMVGQYAMHLLPILVIIKIFYQQAKQMQELMTQQA